MLPSVEPDFSNREEFDLAATMTPAKEVGGDFYDFYMLDENHLVLTVADVSGKGVGAALFMVISKTILKNFALIAGSAYSEGREPDLAAIMERVNKQLFKSNEEKMFVTVFFSVLNIKTGEFAYVNAGHNPPLVRHKEYGDFTYIRNTKKNCITTFEDGIAEAFLTSNLKVHIRIFIINLVIYLFVLHCELNFEVLCQLAGYTKSSIINWLKKLIADSYGELYDKANSWQPRELTKDDLAQIK